MSSQHHPLYSKLLHSLRSGRGCSLFTLKEDGSGIEKRSPHLTPNLEMMMEENHNSKDHINHYSISGGSLSHDDASQFVREYMEGPRRPQSMIEHDLAYEILAMPDNSLSLTDNEKQLDKFYHTAMPSVVMMSPWVVKKPN
jgi:hypothetical protein